jgi:hypothetical protein
MPSYRAFPSFLSNLDAMVKEAKAANIKVILGTTPPISTNASLYTTQINAAIAGYCQGGLRSEFRWFQVQDTDRRR